MSNKRKSGKLEPVVREKRFGFKMIAAVVFAAAIVSFYVAAKTPASIVPGNGILSTPISAHDFGSVSAGRGAVTAEVPLINLGDDDLVISFLDSSCGCTSARVINGDEVGPVFGMSSHGKSPENWKTTIKPGQQATLKIYYDPLVHKKFRGPATRVVTINTNGKTTPERQIRIKVTQTD